MEILYLLLGGLGGLYMLLTQGDKKEAEKKGMLKATELLEYINNTIDAKANEKANKELEVLIGRLYTIKHLEEQGQITNAQERDSIVSSFKEYKNDFVGSDFIKDYIEKKNSLDFYE